MPTYQKYRRQGTFHLRQLVEESCQTLASRLEAQAINTVIDVPDDQMIFADRELLRKAVQNLVLSAIAAMPDGGSLVATSASSPNAVELEIADTGESLFDEELHRAFNPSGANHRGTTGWSLAIVKQIVETLGGDATVANCPEGGVAFTLRIPQPIALEAAA